MPVERSTVAPVVLALTVVVAGACGPHRPAGSAPAVLASVDGLATYYGPGFHGQRTASGSVFNQHQLVAAHPRYPFGTIVRVTNLENDRVVVVRIVDRGPVKRQQRKGVIIDLSTGAARRLRMVEDGVVKVRLDVLGWGESAVTVIDPRQRAALTPLDLRRVDLSARLGFSSNRDALTRLQISTSHLLEIRATVGDDRRAADTEAEVRA